MKYILTFLFCLSFCFAKSQIVFQSNLGTQNFRTVTLLIDPVNNRNVTFYYIDSKHGPYLVVPIRDTIVNGTDVLTFHFDKNNDLYFMAFKKDLSSLSLYDTNMNLMDNMTNDSYYYNQVNSSKSSTPSLSGIELFSLFKLLLL